MFKKYLLFKVLVDMTNNKKKGNLPGLIESYVTYMNRGKSMKVILREIYLEYSHRNVKSFAPAANWRDGDYISALGGRIKIPAIITEEPENILSHIGDEDDDIIDEITLYGAPKLDEKGNIIKECENPMILAKRMLNVLFKISRKGNRVIAALLDKTYRGEPWAVSSAVKAYSDYIWTGDSPEEDAPECTIIESDGEKCTRKARYSARFVSCDDSEDPNIVSYQVDKENKHEKKYRWDDYFARTHSVESNEEKSITERKYTCACPVHHKVPWARQTKRVINYVVDAKNPVSEDEVKTKFKDDVPESKLERMLKFSLEEGRLMKNEKGFYVPMKYVIDKDFPLIVVPENYQDFKK